MEKHMKKLFLTLGMITTFASPLVSQVAFADHHLGVKHEGMAHGEAAHAGMAHGEAAHAGNDIKKHVASIKSGKTIVAHVEGMVCDFCARGLEKVFGKKDAVKNIIVSLEQGTVTIQMHPNKNLSDDEIVKIIKGNGINTTSINRKISPVTVKALHEVVK